MKAEAVVGPSAGADSGLTPARAGRSGELVVQELHGRLYEQAYRGNLFVAQAIVTAPVIYTTVGATGGPLIWNGSTNKNVVPVAVGWGLSTASGVAGSLGLTGGTGQPSAPSSTTAIDGNRNLLLGGAAPASNAYRVGTVVNAGNFLLPFAQVGTGAVTLESTKPTWVDLEGCMVVPPQSWMSVSPSATLTSAVITISLVYEEVPV